MLGEGGERSTFTTTSGLRTRLEEEEEEEGEKAVFVFSNLP